MTTRVVSPVVPPAAPVSRAPSMVGVQRALPVAQLPARDVRSTICGTAAIDCNGRLVEATVITALDWTPGTRLHIRASGGLVLVSADEGAVFPMARQGQVRLPATVRHWCGLTAGSRVLLVADPAAGLLVVHPPAALHTMITQFHASVLGGDAA